MLTNLQFANIMASNNQNNKDYASCLVLLAATEWASGAVRSDCTCSFPSTMAYVFTVKSLWKSFSSSPKPKPKETVPVHSKATYYPVIAEWPATHVLMRSPRHTMMQVLYTRTLHGYPEKFKTPWVLEKLSVMTQILCSLWRRLVWQLHYFLLLTAAATMLTRSTTFLWNYSTIGNFHGPTPFFFSLLLEPTCELCILTDFRFQISNVAWVQPAWWKKRQCTSYFIYATVRELHFPSCASLLFSCIDHEEATMFMLQKIKLRMTAILTNKSSAWNQRPQETYKSMEKKLPLQIEGTRP